MTNDQLIPYVRKQRDAAETGKMSIQGYLLLGVTGAFDDISTGTTNSLKNFYPPRRLRPMVNVEAAFTRLIKTDLPAGAAFVGKGGIIRFAANMNPPQNVGWAADGDNMIAPIDRDEDQFTLKPKVLHGDFQIGVATRAAANTGQFAFNGGELARRVEETTQDLGKRREVTYVGTHGTGRLARVLSDGSNNFVADKPEGVQLLREKMRISVRTTDGGDTVRDSLDNRTITAIAVSTNTVTYSGADQTLVAGDHVHAVTKAAQTSLSTVMPNGLRGIVDDGTLLVTFQGLSRTTYPKLKANVKGNGGVLRNLTEDILIDGCDETRQRSQVRVTHALFNTGQARKYVAFVAPDRRFPLQPGQRPKYITGYGEGPDKTGLRHIAPGVDFEFIIAVDCVPREIYLLNIETFFHYEAQEADWWEGGMLKPVPTDGGFKLAYFGALAAVENLGNDYCIGNTKIADLKDPLTADA